MMNASHTQSDAAEFTINVGKAYMELLYKLNDKSTAFVIQKQLKSNI